MKAAIERSEEPPASGPRAFVRDITTPPGPPWTQHQVAVLDAQSGAPAPLETLLVAVRRVDAWRPGKAARFAVGYVRRKDAPAGVTAEHVTSTGSLILRFEPEKQRARRRSHALVTALAACIAVLLISGAFTAAWSGRSAVDDAVSRAETRAETMRRHRQAVARSTREAQALDHAGLRRGDLNVVLADLAWADAHRESGASVIGVHWRPGDLILETRGFQTPLHDVGGLSEASSSPGRHLWRVARPSRSEADAH